MRAIAKRQNGRKKIKNAPGRVNGGKKVVQATATKENLDGIPQNVEPRHPSEPASALTMYMREVGTVELLTPDEEVKLAAKVKRGNA